MEEKEIREKTDEAKQGQCHKGAENADPDSDDREEDDSVVSSEVAQFTLARAIYLGAGGFSPIAKWQLQHGLLCLRDVGRPDKRPCPFVFAPRFCSGKFLAAQVRHNLIHSPRSSGTGFRCAPIGTLADLHGTLQGG